MRVASQRTASAQRAHAANLELFGVVGRDAGAHEAAGRSGPVTLSAALGDAPGRERVAWVDEHVVEENRLRRRYARPSESGPTHQHAEEGARDRVEHAAVVQHARQDVPAAQHRHNTRWARTAAGGQRSPSLGDAKHGDIEVAHDLSGTKCVRADRRRAGSRVLAHVTDCTLARERCSHTARRVGDAVRMPASTVWHDVGRSSRPLITSVTYPLPRSTTCRPAASAQPGRPCIRSARRGLTCTTATYGSTRTRNSAPGPSAPSGPQSKVPQRPSAAHSDCARHA
jgi:hypothetical protein